MKKLEKQKEEILFLYRLLSSEHLDKVSKELISSKIEKVGVSRDQFYIYYKEDPDFRKAVDDVNKVNDEKQLLKKEKQILFLNRLLCCENIDNGSKELINGKIKSLVREILEKLNNIHGTIYDLE